MCNPHPIHTTQKPLSYKPPLRLSVARPLGLASAADGPSRGLRFPGAGVREMIGAGVPVYSRTFAMADHHVKSRSAASLLETGQRAGGT